MSAGYAPASVGREWVQAAPERSRPVVCTEM
jgi:hypothetical protein